MIPPSFSKKTLHKRFHQRNRALAFTLVEVVLTMGIMAAFISVLGVVSILLSQSRESALETRAAHIAHQIINDLSNKIPPPPAIGAVANKTDFSLASTAALVKGVNSSSCTLQSIDLTKAGTFSAFYDRDGVPVDEGDPSEQFMAQLTIAPVTQDDRSPQDTRDAQDFVRTGLISVAIQIQSCSPALPAAAAGSLTSATTTPASSLSNPIYRFFSKITLPLLIQPAPQ